jgi:LAO/AO transport system kinase
MSTPYPRFQPSAAELTRGIQNGNRACLSRAITLAESKKAADQLMYQQLMKNLAGAAQAIRIGISGVPGVGKSTFIEVFGNHVIDLKKKVAVLAVDPSSEKTKGSILGDKTRMETLARNPHAFIRPTPAGLTLGGVANSTAKSIALCEAAGFDVVMVETVGVGQSETAVRHLVDFFLVLMLPGAGDELQGIKKGILEVADVIVINKADGDNLPRARLAQAELQAALHYVLPPENGWTVPVLTCSALEGTGIGNLWLTVEQFVQQAKASGSFWAKRRQQRGHAFSQLLHEKLFQLLDLPGIGALTDTLRQQVMDEQIPADQAVQQVWQKIAEKVDSC